MARLKFFNLSSLWRAVLVAAVAGLFGSVLSLLLSNLLDSVYRASGSDWVYTVFYTLSSMRQAIVVVLWVGILGLFSNWILYPSFQAFSRTVAQSLNPEDNAEPPALPRQFAELEQMLAHTRKDLQLWRYATLEAEKRKDELVVYLAHDLRTPLTSVLGYLELLCESPALPAESRSEFAAVALRKARRMKALVEELFEVTRFNIGSIELRKGPISAGVLLRQLVQEMGPMLEMRGQSVELEVEENTSLFADPVKLARAVDNVLHNASNYAPHNTAIRLACVQSEQQAEIRISNYGTEISQAELNRFFDQFYRGDSARSSTGGSGLGLAIAKSIIEAHGGWIRAENKNRVTTFIITLPGAPPLSRKSGFC